ncbi:MAG: hypothetical protein ABII75_00390 [Candidatus Omnitrophota bacterium]
MKIKNNKKSSLILKLTAGLLIQTFMMMNCAQAAVLLEKTISADDYYSRKESIDTLAPKLQISQEGFTNVLKAITDRAEKGLSIPDKIAISLLDTVNKSSSIPPTAIDRAVKQLNERILRGGDFTIGHLIAAVRYRARLEDLFSDKIKDIVCAIENKYLENILKYDEIPHLKLGPTPKEDKPYIRSVILNPEYIRTLFEDFFEKKIEIEDLTKISVNNFDQGNFKRVYLVNVETMTNQIKEEFDFILKVSKANLFEEALDVVDEDLTDFRVHNYVKSGVEAAELLHIYGLHPRFGRYFLFKKQSTPGASPRFKMVIIEGVKKGVNPRQIEGILRSKLKNRKIPTQEEFHIQRNLVYRHAIATYTLSYVVLGKRSITDFFPNNIIFEKNRRDGKTIFKPELIDLDKLSTHATDEFRFIGSLIDEVFPRRDEAPIVSLNVMFHAILDIYGKEKGKEILESALKKIENIQKSPRYRDYEIKEFKEYATYIEEYLGDSPGGINGYEEIKWLNVEGVRKIMFLPEEVKKRILNVFMDYPIAGDDFLQEGILEIVREKRDVLENEDLKAEQEREAALDEIENELSILFEKKIKLDKSPIVGKLAIMFRDLIGKRVKRSEEPISKKDEDRAITKKVVLSTKLYKKETLLQSEIQDFIEQAI